MTRPQWFGTCPRTLAAAAEADVAQWWRFGGALAIMLSLSAALSLGTAASAGRLALAVTMLGAAVSLPGFSACAHRLKLVQRSDRCAATMVSFAALLPWVDDAWTRGGVGMGVLRLFVVSGAGWTIWRFVVSPHAENVPRAVEVGARLFTALLLVLAFGVPALEGAASRPFLWLIAILAVVHALFTCSSAALLATGAVAAVAIVLEAAIRILIALGFTVLAINTGEDAQSIHWHAPGQQFVWTGQAGFPKECRVTGRWNRWGFNDREPPEAPRQEPVVLVLGDSFVEALQVGADRAFYRVAEGALASAGRRVRTVALGWSGAGARKSLELLRTYAPRLRPAAIVYAFSYNDVRDDYEPWSRATVEAAAKSDHGVPPWDGLVAGRFVAFRVRQMMRPLIGHGAGPYPLAPEALTFAPDGVLDTSEAWKEFFGNVHAMARWARNENARLIVLELSPGNPAYYDWACGELGRISLSCDPDLPRARLRSDAGQTAYEFVTTFREMAAALAAGEKPAFTYDGHYNEVGHRIVGEALVPALVGLDEATTSVVAGKKGEAQP